MKKNAEAINANFFKNAAVVDTLGIFLCEDLVENTATGIVSSQEHRIYCLLVVETRLRLP
jgi:hypothetical protein